VSSILPSIRPAVPGTAPSLALTVRLLPHKDEPSTRHVAIGLPNTWMISLAEAIICSNAIAVLEECWWLSAVSVWPLAATLLLVIEAAPLRAARV